jgi:hypothetical protein
MSADAYFANNVILLNCDGSDVTVFTDDSDSHKALTSSGGAQIIQATNPYGDMSGVAKLQSATNCIYTTAASVDFSMGSGDFTIEAWVYLTAFSVANNTFITLTNDADTVEIMLGSLSANQKLRAYIYHTAGYRVDITGSTTITLNTWHHVAVTRNGDVHRIFLDGVLENSVTVSHTLPDIELKCLIGDVAIGLASYEMKGLIYDARVKKGVAIYTAAFTVPTSRFSTLFSIAITLTESIVANDFIAYVHELKNGVKRLVTAVTAGTTNLYLSYKEPVMVTLMPVQGDLWTASKVYALNDLVIASNTATTPYYFKRVAAGTSGTTEPTWTTTAGTQCNDGSVTNAWECVAGLTQPITQGPLIPS